MGSENCIGKPRLGTIKLDNSFLDVFLRWKNIIQNNLQLLNSTFFTFSNREKFINYLLATNQLLFRARMLFLSFAMLRLDILTRSYF